MVFALGRRLTREEKERFKGLIERVKAEYRRLRGSTCGYCGQPFNHLETREYVDSEGELKVYLICVHRTPDGRKVSHSCGSNKYTYVSKSHQAIGLTLSNILNDEQWVNYVINIIETMVARVTSDPEGGVRLRPKVVEGLRRVKATVEGGLRELGGDV
jgi:hypothetical protein